MCILCFYIYVININVFEYSYCVKLENLCIVGCLILFDWRFLFIYYIDMWWFIDKYLIDIIYFNIMILIGYCIFNFDDDCN